MSTLIEPTFVDSTPQKQADRFSACYEVGEPKNYISITVPESRRDYPIDILHGAIERYIKKQKMPLLLPHSPSL